MVPTLEKQLQVKYPKDEVYWELQTSTHAATKVVTES